jgi:hypothetical protein
VIPVSVTALLDGTRFYVASYQIATTCPDPNVTVSPCVVPSVTVFDANTLTPKYPNPNTSTLTLLTSPPFAVNAAGKYQYAVPPMGSCAMTPLYPALYSPSNPRFRVFTVASEDSSRVYVSMCDAGAVAVINTTGNNANNPESPLPPDTVVGALPMAPQANSASALQSPIFLLMGQ